MPQQMPKSFDIQYGDTHWRVHYSISTRFYEKTKRTYSHFFRTQGFNVKSVAPNIPANLEG
jgi:hypothetical protein